MKYIKSEDLDRLDDNVNIYVNRNVLNATIASYEINSEYQEYNDELSTLLSLWKEVYKSEKNTKRINLFIKMKNGEIKRCFKNYKALPLGSFGLTQE